MTPRAVAGRAQEITFRPATAVDLDDCGRVWREALNDYLPSVGQPEMPAELGPIGRLHAHLLATDPERFWVAERGGRIVAFGAAVERGAVWFLSMLFVSPDEQRAGLGRALLARILPPGGSGRTLAVGADSAQPVSNGLYASLGMLPRMPLWLLVGRPRDGWRAPPLPRGVRAERIPADADGSIDPAVQAEIDALDRAVAGLAHPEDHRFVRREGRLVFVYRGSDGVLLGHGAAASSGRLSPVAVRDAALLGPVVGHLLEAVVPAGASAVWTPGAADGAFRVLLDAGLRLEGFPVLVGWTRPFADFERYVPISPGLL